MSEQLTLHKSRREKLMKKLAELYNAVDNAGIGSVGDYENEIQKTEIQFEELVKKIDAIETKEQSIANKGQPVPDSKVFIYVVTGTNARIKDAIKEADIYQFYTCLKPPNHDDAELYEWRPFSSENSSIQALLDKLKDEGYKFTVYYLDGHKLVNNSQSNEVTNQDFNIEDIIDEEIDNNINNIIAIVDLLTLDGVNEKIAQRFNTKYVLRVITPICQFLPNQLKFYMIAKRKITFNLLEYKLKKDEFSVYKPSASEASIFLQELRTVIKKEKPCVNMIETKISPEADKLRSLKPNL